MCTWPNFESEGFWNSEVAYSLLYKREGNWGRSKCVAQLFLGSLLGTRRSAIGQFFFPHSNSPRSLFENRLDPVSFSFLNWRIRHFHISHNTLCLRVSCSPTRSDSFAYALFTFLSGRLKTPKEDEDKAYAKLFACVGGQETHKQRVLWEMWKWRVIINRQRAVTRVVIRVSRTCPSTD